MQGCQVAKALRISRRSDVARNRNNNNKGPVNGTDSGDEMVEINDSYNCCYAYAIWRLVMALVSSLMNQVVVVWGRS